jgi:CheY-like chemotaxis protein
MATAAPNGLVSAIRETGGYSQEALARELGVSFATVNAWERGRSQPRPSHLQSLRSMAKSLGIRTDIMVLAIDDDPATCAVIEGMVAGASIPAAVKTTTDPFNALILSGALDPDLLLIDIMMPGIDGFDLAERLEEIRGDRMPRVVFMTAASNDPEIIARAEESGHVLIAKPFGQDTIETLLDAVATGAEPALS